MGKLSRDKGSRLELWVCKQIDEQLGIKAKRNLSQYQSKGQADIILPSFSIECKHYANRGSWTHKKDWWDQAVAEAGELEPVLIYKYDYQDARAVVRLGLINKEYNNTDMICTLSLDSLWYLMREKLAEGMDEKKNL